ncbi:MAG: helix-turn-helix transcriptional regulator [Lachnospiraceae bacterium]|nr:helix-turn-helix transcriptional regulator [Lachnospiraceae bacterium]
MNKRIRGRTITTWFITFITIFMAQLMGWVLVIQLAIHYTKKQTNEVYYKALNVLIQSFDNSMELIYSMLNVMATDENITKGIYSVNDVWQNELTRRTLASFKLQYSFIDDIYIYFQNSERVVSTNTAASACLFYDTYADVMMSLEEWKEALQQIYFKQDVSWKNKEGKETLWVLHSLPVFSEENNNKITVVVKFNSSYVQGLADNFSADNSIAVVVSNAAGDIIVKSENMSVIKQKSGITRVSEYNNWIYTAYMSGEAVKIYENGLPLVLFVCLGTEVLIFIFAFFFFVKTNYSPFTELMEYVNRQNPDGVVSSSEYVYIRDSFDEIVRKTKKDEEEFINKMNRFKIAQLIQIMTSRISMEQVDRMIMEEMQLSYVFDSCAVLLFSGDLQDYIQKQTDCLGVMQELGIGMAKDNILYGCSFGYQEMVVCIFKLEADVDSVKRKLTEVWRKAEEELSGSYIMAVSSLVREDNQLGKAYKEAKFAMQGAMDFSVTGVLLYDEIQESVQEVIRENKEEYIVHMVKEYIMEHYAESDLTVDKLCREIGRSVSYISRLFKEKTGQNILYYINLVRTEEAKKLLWETNEEISVDEIGRKVGFTNSNSFIRIFKKYEQVTPGRYREQNILIHYEKQN